jgi:hypothetical protein
MRKGDRRGPMPKALAEAQEDAPRLVFVQWIDPEKRR